MKPGIYHNIPSEQYHGSAGLSRSRLKVLLEGTPLDFRAAPPVEETDAMRRGTALHLAVLEPDLFLARVVAQPKFDRRTKQGKADAEAFDEANTGRLIISADDYDQCVAAAKLVRSKRGPAAALRSGHAEVSMWWEQNGELVKARPDFLDVDGGFTVDVKSTARGLDDRSIVSILVDQYAAMQAAMVVNGAAALTGKRVTPYLLVVRLVEPIDMRFVRIDPEWIEYGEAQFLTALSVYTQCTSSGEWPGWVDRTEPTAVPAPNWIKSRTEEMCAALTAVEAE